MTVTQMNLGLMPGQIAVAAAPEVEVTEPGGEPALVRLAREYAIHVGDSRPPALRDLEVMMTFGRFLRVKTSGLALFEAGGNWDALGVEADSARTRVFARPPRWRLADPALTEPLRTIRRHAVTIPERFGQFYEWLSAYYVPYRALPEATAVFDGVKAQWDEYVQARIIDRLNGELREWAEVHVAAAAADAYRAMCATATVTLGREAFVERVLKQALDQFPTEADVRDKLRIELRDPLPASAHPTRETVEFLLGVKGRMDEEARVLSAHAETAEADLQAARLRAEGEAERQRREMQMLHDMHAQIEQEAREAARSELSPIMARIAFARERLAESLAGGLEAVTDGKALTEQQKRSIRSAMEFWRMGDQDETPALRNMVDNLEAALGPAQPKGAGRRHGKRETPSQALASALESLNTQIALQQAQLKAQAAFAEGFHFEFEESSMSDMEDGNAPAAE
jgi:hypothetical protein